MNATRSQYYKAKRDGLKSQHLTTKETCYYCGQNGHGKRASKSIRKNACPAYGKTYGHCGRPNHIETVCMQKTKPKPPLPQKAHNDQEGAIFDSLCSTSCGVSIDHHLYNQLDDCWVRQSSLKPQPSKVHSQHHATAHCARNHRLDLHNHPSLPIMLIEHTSNSGSSTTTPPVPSIHVNFSPSHSCTVHQCVLWSTQMPPQ